jgi:hypothetical protein
MPALHRKKQAGKTGERGTREGGTAQNSRCPSRHMVLGAGRRVARRQEVVLLSTLLALTGQQGREVSTGKQVKKGGEWGHHWQKCVQVKLVCRDRKKGGTWRHCTRSQLVVGREGNQVWGPCKKRCPRGKGLPDRQEEWSCFFGGLGGTCCAVMCMHAGGAAAALTQPPA